MPALSRSNIFWVAHFLFVVNGNLMKINFFWTRHSKKICNINHDFQGQRDGSNEYSNYQPGALNTTDQLIKDLDNIDIVFHIGDLSYANGYLSEWDQFTAQVEPIASRVPYMVARLPISITRLFRRDWFFNHLLLFLNPKPLQFHSCSGNHERDWPNTGSFYANMDSGGECGVPAETMFYFPAENRAKFW